MTDVSTVSENTMIIMVRKVKSAYQKARKDWNAPTPKKAKKVGWFSIITGVLSVAGLISTNIQATGVNLPDWAKLTLAVTSSGSAIAAVLAKLQT